MMNIGEKAPEVLGINEKGEEILLSNYQERRLCFTFIRRTIPRDVRQKLVACEIITQP